MSDLFQDPAKLAAAIAIVVTGWTVTALIGGRFVAWIVRPYQDAALPQGLAGGGHKIGLLERTLILLLILAGEPGGVGFLIAAKSILRFDVASKGADDPQTTQKISEYIIIGTLASFTWAFATGFLTAEILEIARQWP
ncbi:MAG: hypothetical protein AAGA87_15955 [Pseudomonadota bacterium]